MKTSLLFILVFTTTFLFAQKKQVCLTIDDLPFVSYGMNETVFQKKTFDKLVNSLKRNDIPAIGFVVGKKLYDKDKLNDFQYGLLKSWVDNKLELGNHTFSHPDYNKLSCKEYSEDIIKGETEIKEILYNKGKKIKYFRHPFLHTGNSKEKSDSLNKFLTEMGYKVAPVTIDNDDYLFALAYKRAFAQGDSNLMLKIGHDYITYMENKVNYFEKQAKELFGRNIRQILLIHASLLNADYVDSLSLMLKRNNYEFVSLDKVMKDKAYNTPITVFNEWGISWIDRWALSKSKKGDFFKDDPATPDYIIKLTK